VKVQLLSFPGCPNVAATREALRRALVASGLPPEFEEADVTSSVTPEPLKAWGSPTILVDGRDVAGSEPTGPCCRLYGSQRHTRGVPPEDLIQRAIRNARPGSGHWLGSLATVPGALVALLPAATCPACLGAYFGVLSALGLGFLLTNRVLVPVVVGFLVLGIAIIAWSNRKPPTLWSYHCDSRRFWRCGRGPPHLEHPHHALCRRRSSRWSIPLEPVAQTPALRAFYSTPPFAEARNNTMKKRTVEVFTAGCPCCDDAVKLVQSLVCPSCDLQILDMRGDKAAQTKAKQYGVKRVPAVVVNGKLADCCQIGGVDEKTLRSLGVGSP